MTDAAAGSRTPTSHSYFSQRLRLHYLDWGNREAPDMLLVHGLQDHCHAWDWFARLFGDDYRVTAPDLRGHGDSEWVRGSSYHQIDYVYDLAQLVKQGALGPTVLVGHSLGGTLAALYAGAYPTEVSALVIIEGIGLWPGLLADMNAAEKIRQWVGSTRELAGRLPHRYEPLQEACARMQQANAHLSPDQANYLTIHGSDQNEDASYSWKFDNYTHAFPAFGISHEDTVSLWRAIRCPVLIINATNGYDHRIGQDGTLEAFNEAKTVTIPAAGHWVHHDRLDEVAALIGQFLKS
ncbi:MAG: alpha/beta hydrolase [Gammaproteobacteria bacterium]|nr:alpha/beta hydrolase [Gammaproteobacteria bacterium]